jgi:hypothetical protein
MQKDCTTDWTTAQIVRRYKYHGMWITPDMIKGWQICSIDNLNIHRYQSGVFKTIKLAKLGIDKLIEQINMISTNLEREYRK